MKASELILKLQEAVAQKCDMEVLMRMPYAGWIGIKVEVGDDGEEWFFFIEEDDEQ